MLYHRTSFCPWSAPILWLSDAFFPEADISQTSALGLLSFLHCLCKWDCPPLQLQLLFLCISSPEPICTPDCFLEFSVSNCLMFHPDVLLMHWVQHIQNGPHQVLKLVLFLTSIPQVLCPDSKGIHQLLLTPNFPSGPTSNLASPVSWQASNLLGFLHTHLAVYMQLHPSFPIDGKTYSCCDWFL